MLTLEEIELAQNLQDELGDDELTQLRAENAALKQRIGLAYQHSELETQEKLLAAQHRIKELRGQMLNIANGCRIWGGEAERARKMIEAILATPDNIAEIDALKKDAERYRWLRDNSAYVGVNPHAKTCLWVLRGIYEIEGEGFDAAIDAAMKAES